MKDRDGEIVAVDFAGYSFLPPSFFNFVLIQEFASFAHEIRLILKHPSSPNDRALVIASCALVPFGTNNMGVPRRLRSRLR